MQTEQYSRKPLHVEAAQITVENMAEVSEWCKGPIRTSPTGEKYIHVPVIRPVNDRQLEARVGDWVVHAGRGFKVYPPQAFRRTFDKSSDPACGDTSRTADNEPCVLNYAHKLQDNPVACRSFNDYRVIAQYGISKLV